MRQQRLLPLLLGLAACSDTSSYEPGPAYGELGVGVFLYECSASGDPYCASGLSVSDEFPRAFALGGRVSFRYDWRDSSEHIGDPTPQLQTASPERLVRQGEGFTALATGYAALLAVTGNSEVVDLVHLHVREPAALRATVAGLPGATPVRELTLDVGDTLELQALLLDADAVILGGVTGHAWTTTDPAIVKIVSGADSGRVQLEGVAAGTTTVTLLNKALTLTIDVTVESDISEPATGTTTGDSTGEPGSSSGSTDDTGTTGEDTSADSSGSSGGVL